MGHKIVMEADGTGGSTQDAMQAIDIGAYREVALLVTVTTAGASGDKLYFQTANEPFDSAFANATVEAADGGKDTYIELDLTYGTDFPSTSMAYCSEFARYLRWDAGSNTGSAKFTIDAFVKKTD